MCPMDFQQFTSNFFYLLQRCTKSDSDFVRLPLQTYLYSETAVMVVESRLHEPCSVYYFASFYVRQKVSCSFVPLTPGRGDATVDTLLAHDGQVGIGPQQYHSAVWQKPSKGGTVNVNSFWLRMKSDQLNKS